MRTLPTTNHKFVLHCLAFVGSTFCVLLWFRDSFTLSVFNRVGHYAICEAMIYLSTLMSVNIWLLNNSMWMILPLCFGAYTHAVLLSYIRIAGFSNRHLQSFSTN